jgi:iron-sulfur cluster repair protein YtfE (RIC family)
MDHRKVFPLIIQSISINFCFGGNKKFVKADKRETFAWSMLVYDEMRKTVQQLWKKEVSIILSKQLSADAKFQVLK